VQTLLVKDFLADHSGNSGEFPRVLSVTDESEELHLLLEVSPDLDGFRGHFPGNPVLAGIVQLHWAARFSGELFNFQSVPMEIKRLKFKNLVQPPATLTLILRKRADTQIEFEFTSVELSHSSGVLVFEHQPA
jgi:3-hydroxymyristoyl/3-hydroxydecanoyl-(acyl carrier protein) dehydratase